MSKSIKVKVITRARINRIKQEADGFKVYTTASAVKEKANKAVISILSKFFNKRPRDFKIVRGKHSKDKTIQIIS